MKHVEFSAGNLAKKMTAYVCIAALAAGVAGAQGTAYAAKKPKLSSSRINMNVGDTKKVTVKNSAKKAKVTWKSSKTKVAKITKKTSGKNAYAQIKGVGIGTSKVTAVYKLGKKKVPLSVTVVVKDAGRTDENKPAATDVPTATNAPATNAPATATPANNAATGTPAAEPTATQDGSSGNPAATTAPPQDLEDIWVSTWGMAEERNDINDNAMPQMRLEDSTIRQIIRVTTSGNNIRFRLSNQYGDSDVVIKSMHIAKQVEADKSTIDTSTDTVVTKDEEEEIVIPAGKVVMTDEVAFSVDALENIAVSMYFGETPSNNITGHRGARATTYQMKGDNVSTETLSDYKTTTSWFFLADVSLKQPAGSKAVVCFGDSITDGYGTDAYFPGRKPDLYIRWGDYFARRLQANDATKNISVINEGIGANSMMGSYPTDAGKDRFERDLLEHDGVGYCIVLFGVNDLKALSDTSIYDVLKPEYEKMVALAHENDIKIYAAPILPFGTSKDYYSEASEEVRKMLNDWMRSDESGFDGIIDFESALADPKDPKSIREEYTHGDGLHPYDGYDVMAEAIDLSMFQ